MKSKILCLHGFLGKPSDFDFLNESYHVLAPELSEYVHLSLGNMYVKLLQEGYFNDIKAVIGYSFGARLGLSLCLSEKLDLPIFCMAGHMGLATLEEKNKRIVFEQNIINKLGSLNKPDFLAYWNSLPIFKEDKDLVNGHFAKAVLFFKNYGLSKQLYLPKLLQGGEKIYFIYGEGDTKYCEYSKKNLKSFNITYLSGVGHRVILSHTSIKNWLKEFI